MRGGHRSSYWKTNVISFAGVAACVGGLALLCYFGGPLLLVAPMALAFTAGIAIGGSVTAGGLVCLWRDSREGASKPDVFARHANRSPGAGLLSRLPFRNMLGSSIRPGDVVRVRHREEITATLDSQGTVDGLPFMPEMEAFCDKIFRVHRLVDKINDMRHKTGLRRMLDTVTLTGVRCSGVHHGRCEAECQILWKDVWLQRLPSKQVLPIYTIPPPQRYETATPERRNDDHTYCCQITELWEASRAMSPFDIRQDLRPLLSGNISLVGYLIAMLTRAFNMAQRLRGGVGYPFMPLPAANRTPLIPKLDLMSGEAIVIRNKAEIEQTLIKSRNQGLWFDKDMIRFCGQPDIVRKRVTRIIHEATRKMVVMKIPCIVLENAIATGEFLRLCPQHEYIFWRELWLKRPGKDRPQY